MFPSAEGTQESEQGAATPGSKGNTVEQEQSLPSHLRSFLSFRVGCNQQVLFQRSWAGVRTQLAGEGGTRKTGAGGVTGRDVGQGEGRRGSVRLQ